MVWWKAILLGAVAFWSPVVVVELARPLNYNIVLVNVLPLAAVLAAFAVARRARARSKGLAAWMLAGIYAFGPAVIFAITARSGPGFAAPPWHAHDALWFILVSLFPPLSLVVAGYNGTMLGMLAATAALAAIALIALLGPLPTWLRPSSTR